MKKRIWNLTSREYEVLELVVMGYSNPQIAKKLFITTHTVKAHITSLYHKARVRSRVLLSVRAVKYGIIDYQISEEEYELIKLFTT